MGILRVESSCYCVCVCIMGILVLFCRSCPSAHSETFFFFFTSKCLLTNKNKSNNPVVEKEQNWLTGWTAIHFSVGKTIGEQVFVV